MRFQWKRNLKLIYIITFGQILLIGSGLEILWSSLGAGKFAPHLLWIVRMSRLTWEVTTVRLIVWPREIWQVMALGEALNVVHRCEWLTSYSIEFISSGDSLSDKLRFLSHKIPRSTPQTAAQLL